MPTYILKILTEFLPFGILNGMKSVKTNILTIDKAGRMVIPQKIRKQFGFNVGSKLELDASGNVIILRLLEEKPALTKEGGLYVHEGIPEYGTLPDAVDLAREQRDRVIWERKA